MARFCLARLAQCLEGLVQKPIRLPVPGSQGGGTRQLLFCLGRFPAAQRQPPALHQTAYVVRLCRQQGVQQFRSVL